MAEFALPANSKIGTGETYKAPAGANGLEISKDGKWYYVAQWGNRSFMRLSRGKTPVDRKEIPLGFRVDNVRWAPDGKTLLVAGQVGAAGQPGGQPAQVAGERPGERAHHILGIVAQHDRRLAEGRERGEDQCAHGAGLGGRFGQARLLRATDLPLLGPRAGAGLSRWRLVRRIQGPAVGRLGRLYPAGRRRQRGRLSGPATRCR